MSTIIFEDRITIPDWVQDQVSFRKWASSEEFPEQGRFAFLDGQLWVDLAMEEIFTHNLLKAEITAVLTSIVRRKSMGYFLTDGVLYSHPEAGLSTEADGLFLSFEGIESGRTALVQKASGFTEVEGEADIAIEIVSPTSVRKDTVVLRDLYHRAGVREYWLIDARGPRRQGTERTPAIRFEILKSTPEGYAEQNPADDWQRSDVLDASFRLISGTDRLGHPQFSVETR